MIPWRDLQDILADAGLESRMMNASRPILYVDTKQQMLSCISVTHDNDKSYRISTSKYGNGQHQDSYQTPTGIHRIAHKIGDHEDPGRVFKARIATNEICLADDYEGQDDVITSRILWLDGLEDGFNHGAQVDSYKRFIYIHGTADENNIGRPASVGCIRMTNDNVIELFDHVEVDDLVIIE